MPDSGASGLTVAELEHILKRADPVARLVPPRLLRRIIKQHAHIGGLGLQVPHHRSLVIGRQEFRALVERGEIELGPETDLPATLLLIAGPEPGKLAGRSREALLLRYWRILFHARIHVAMDQRFRELGATEAGIRNRIDRLGRTEFEEITAVLQQDQYLLPPPDERSIYVEFAAIYLELRSFAGNLRGVYFPNLTSFERIDRLLAEDVDADAIFTATRLEGAPLPVIPEDTGTDTGEDEPLPPPEPPTPEERSFGKFGQRMRRAKRASRRGNLVRAAILRMRAAAVGPPKKRAATEAGARSELDRLAGRLQIALGLSAKETARWRTALVPLLAPATHGIWPVENRLLYDLQKVCVDHERQIFVVDLIGWILSLGRQAIKRPVPGQREVRILKHLRSADRRLRAARIEDRQRQRLADLLQSAMQVSEERLRDRFRPILRDTLDQVGVQPHNLPEHVARDKLIEELLDRIDQLGFLTMGDLRDAVSRNQMKMPDLAGAGEFLHGDRLIQTDRILARALDGVYHRGEVYLRQLQRLSSLAFGTRPGRFLVRYLFLPFGGAYATVVFIEELLHLAGVHRHLPEPPPVEWDPDDLDDPDFEVPVHVHKAPLLTRTEVGIAVGVLGLFFFLLLHVPAFRAAVIRALTVAWRGLRSGLIDLPAWAIQQPLIHRILDSGPVVFMRRYLLRPVLAGTLAAAGCWMADATLRTTSLVSGATLLTAAGLFNSRLGRRTEEALADWFNRNWYWLRADVLPGLFRLTVLFFRLALEYLERLLYTVDEWLRFRSGDSRLSLIVKLTLGVVWFVFTYVVRMVITLFVEPTFNPIKHFPAVTVAAKLILPLLFVLRPAVVGGLAPLTGRTIAELLFGAFFFLLPGLAGFLVWEFKENWKLYSATRAPTLRPVVLGSHGETMRQFLRPGFHSGTVPKLFARLRHAERIAQRTRDWKSARRYRESLHHVELAVRHFVEREMLVLLSQSKRWRSERLSLADVHLATNRIRLDLHAADVGTTDLILAFEEHAGRLTVGILEPGWLGVLGAGRLAALTDALAGVYHMAGVDLAEPITWRQWVEVWQRDQDGQDMAESLLRSEQFVLPPLGAARSGVLTPGPRPAGADAT